MEYGRCKILINWPDWNYVIHTEPDQIKRQGYAINYPFDFEIDNEHKTAEFSSSSSPINYKTTLTSCTCDDFKTRGLPCKHIYRLAVELDIIEIVKRIPPNNNQVLIDEIHMSNDIDNHPEQLKRMKNAKSPKTKPSSIDKEKKTAIFPGSGKTPYKTTLQSCTCRDFTVRGLPCKHIYRLRMELGLLDEQSYIGINTEIPLKNAIENLERLTEKNQRLIKDFLYKSLYEKQDCFPILIDKKTAPLQSLFLLETKNLPDLALRAFKRGEIIDILDERGISGFKRNTSLDSIIKWCLENVPDIHNIFPQAIVFCFSDKFQKAKQPTYEYLKQKFDRDCIGHCPDEEITELLTYYGHNNRTSN